MVLIRYPACFNSRTLGRVRPSPRSYCKSSSFSFNSRTLGRVRQDISAEPITEEEFQFTHPGKGATAVQALSSAPCYRFNSRTLGRVRRTSAPKISLWIEFQFTHPGKGATSASHLPQMYDNVSIHAPWEGCDIMLMLVSLMSCKFQFTHPGKGATP